MKFNLLTLSCYVGLYKDFFKNTFDHPQVGWNKNFKKFNSLKTLQNDRSMSKPLTILSFKLSHFEYFIWRGPIWSPNNNMTDKWL
jgi:hypothetical protein